jgi:hypothetical protein
MPKSDRIKKRNSSEDKSQENNFKSGMGDRTLSGKKKVQKVPYHNINPKNLNTSDSTSNYSPLIVNDIEIQINRFNYLKKKCERVITFNY